MINVDEDLAYFIGVLNSDGCIYHFHDKKADRIRKRSILHVAEKSLEMSQAFREILDSKFNKKTSIRHITKTNKFSI